MAFHIWIATSTRNDIHIMLTTIDKIRSQYRRIFAHVDADAFFASCEAMRNPTLKGKPLAVTGRLGHCVLARSYEARAYGIKVGQGVWEARKLCPDLLEMPVDFSLYAITSWKLMELARTYTDQVEPASIDEAYMDLTPYGENGLTEFGHRFLERAQREIGITVSMGFGRTKTIAKVASDVHKPNGVLNTFDPEGFEQFLARPIGEVPGIGYRTAPYMRGYGIRTIGDFRSISYNQALQRFGKGGGQLWWELHEVPTYSLHTDNRQPKSMMKTESFSPLTNDPVFLERECMKHLERAHIKLLKEGLGVKTVSVMLRTKEFHHLYETMYLPQSTDDIYLLARTCSQLFAKAYNARLTYRSTGVIFHDLVGGPHTQHSLFDNHLRVAAGHTLSKGISKLRTKYGKGVVRVGF